METFAERLRFAMKHRGKTQTDIAVNCNIDKGNLSHYLKGDWLPKQEIIIRIANYLEIEPMFLLGLTDNMVKLDYKVHQSILGKTEEELLLEELQANLTWCSLEELKMLNTIVKTLVKERKPH